MNSRINAICLAALLTAVILPAASMHVAAAGWNHTYSDVEGDVSLANIDITQIRSYADGTDVVLEMTLKGSIENDNETVYWIRVGSQTSNVGVTWVNGNGFIYYYGGGGFDVLNVSGVGHIITGRIPKAQAGPENEFDIFGYAVRVDQSTVRYDWAGPGFQGGGDVNPGNILGMAAWLLAVLLLIPIIIVVIVVIALVMRKKKAPQPPTQQSQYPPPPQYPQQYAPPQQYQAQQPPQQQNQPRPPGQ